MKHGKHRPSPQPPADDILRVLALLALLEWRPEGADSVSEG